MKHTAGEFEGPNCELFFQTWIPEGETRAAVVISHGVGEHSGRYMNIVGPLTQKGFAVWAYDHLGCGSSPGQRGHIDSWEDFRGGLRSFLEWVFSKNQDIPVFLYGHSMGSLVALDYIQRSPEGLQGVVLSGTPVEPTGVGSPAKRLFARLLSRMTPAYSINLGLDPTDLSRDLQVVQAYRDDPLVQQYVSLRWGTEAMSVRETACSHPELVRLPVLFIHGSKDPLNQVSGVRTFFEQIGYADKQLLIYEGSLHEPHNDLDHEIVAADLIKWLENHMPETENAGPAPIGKL